MSTRILLAYFLFLFSSTSQGVTYSWPNAQGVIQYSASVCPEGVKCSVRGATSTTTSTTRARATGRVVPASFFGMHYSSAQFQPWPSVRFSTLRTWDQWPGVSWADIHTARGTYKWTNLDNVVNAAVSHGVDIIYTFGYTPVWASSNATGSCDSGPVGTCYIPANIQDWRDFVTQITTRYKGKIKYWELWNEPNAGNFWKGSNANMVAMAAKAYPIVKRSGGMVLSPAPQGTNANLWMDGYLAAGGKSYFDILSFHGYLYGAPERITALADKMKSVARKYNVSALPIWDTEHSWGDPTWPFGANQDQQAAWLARYIPLSFSKGIARSVWYMWDSYQGQAQWGPLFDATSKKLFKPGTAYRELYNWLINASMDPCVPTGTVYQCHLTRSGGYEGLIVWAASSNALYTASYTVPSQYVRYKTLDATTINISSGAKLILGMKPILLEKL